MFPLCRLWRKLILGHWVASWSWVWDRAVRLNSFSIAARASSVCLTPRRAASDRSLSRNVGVIRKKSFTSIVCSIIISYFTIYITRKTRCDYSASHTWSWLCPQPLGDGFNCYAILTHLFYSSKWDISKVSKLSASSGISAQPATLWDSFSWSWSAIPVLFRQFYHLNPPATFCYVERRYVPLV